MSQAKFIYIFGIILYVIVANISSKFVGVHWFHIFNGLMLSSILYNLLDWKYDEGDINEQSTIKK